MQLVGRISISGARIKSINTLHDFCAVPLPTTKEQITLRLCGPHKLNVICFLPHQERVQIRARMSQLKYRYPGDLEIFFYTKT